MVEAATGWKGLTEAAYYFIAHTSESCSERVKAMIAKFSPVDAQDFSDGEISRKRIFVEHAIRFLKRFRILSERYRNRRKRFALRFSLIAGICNFDRLA